MNPGSTLHTSVYPLPSKKNLPKKKKGGRGKQAPGKQVADLDFHQLETPHKARPQQLPLKKKVLSDVFKASFITPVRH